MLISSRSYDEYVAMFALDDDDLSGSILDCSAGAASFVTVARSLGTKSLAVDPAYGLSRDDLAAAVRDDLLRGTNIAEQHADRFVWDWYGSREARDRMRRAAAARFLASLPTAPKPLVAGELPRLPFRDRTFDLVLCSHLVFTWADVLGLDWHLAALVELVRVCRREVRVFPTVVQGRGDAVPFWTELMAALDDHGIATDERAVPYRFQVTGDRMLVVSRRG